MSQMSFYLSRTHAKKKKSHPIKNISQRMSQMSFYLSRTQVKKIKSHPVKNISQRMTQMSFYLSEALVAPISGAAAFIRKCTTNIWINVFSMPNLAVCTSLRKWKFQLEKCYEGLLKYYLSCIAIYIGKPRSCGLL